MVWDCTTVGKGYCVFRVEQSLGGIVVFSCMREINVRV